MFTCMQNRYKFSVSKLIFVTQDFQKQAGLGAKGSAPGGVSLDTLRRRVPAATTPCAAYGNPTKGQVIKGIRWMPWCQRAMKGAASCEKPRGAASRPRSVDTRMGQPTASCVAVPIPESNRGCGAIPGELKHLSTRRKRKQL